MSDWMREQAMERFTKSIDKSRLLEESRNFLKMKDIPDMIGIFETYCASKGIKKKDGRRKDNSHTYFIEHKCYYGAKCECSIYNDVKDPGFGDTDLYIVMRKRNGEPYLIVAEDNGKRIIEIGYDNEWCFDAEKFRAVVDKYPELFAEMGIKGVK